MLIQELLFSFIFDTLSANKKLVKCEFITVSSAYFWYVSETTLCPERDVLLQLEKIAMTKQRRLTGLFKFSIVLQSKESCDGCICVDGKVNETQTRVLYALNIFCLRISN